MARLIEIAMLTMFAIGAIMALRKVMQRLCEFAFRSITGVM